jgi:hypothetical protein
MNHFTTLTANPSQEDFEYFMKVFSNESDGSGSLVHTITLLDQCVTELVDTGASVNILPKYLLHKPVNFKTAIID